MALGGFVVETARPRRKPCTRDADSLSSGHGGWEEKEDCRCVCSKTSMSINRLMRLHAAQGQPRAVNTRFRVRTTAIKAHLA